MRSSLALVWAAGVLVGQSISARGSVVFSASGTNVSTGTFLSASATFDTVQHGRQLQITLSNLGGPVLATSDILTALFFDLNGVGALTPVSAVLGDCSCLLNGPLSSGKTLGDNWEYLGGLSGIPGGATRGISSVGLGVFGQGNFGNRGQNLGGAPYGIINDAGCCGNGQIPNMQLEDNTMVFTLGGLPSNFSLTCIKDVEFQYGTKLGPSEPMIGPSQVPEPSALALLGLGSAALLFLRRFPR